MKKLTPNLMVDDVNITIEFYKNVLGFELVTTVPDSGQFDWAMMKCGQVEIMFQSTSSLTQDLPQFRGVKPGGTLTLYIDVPEVSPLFDRCRRDATIVKDIQKTFYGTQEFTVRDCNGYTLTFAEGGS